MKEDRHALAYSYWGWAIAGGLVHYIWGFGWLAGILYGLWVIAAVSNVRAALIKARIRRIIDEETNSL